MPRLVPSRHAGRGWVVVVVVCGAVLAFVAPAGPDVRADTVVPFGVRFETNDNGAITIIGNNVLTCPLPGPQCASAQTTGGSGVAGNNNNFQMTNLDADGADYPATFNSSRAALSLPPGGSVLFAGLYWGARQTNASGSTVTQPIDRMLLRPPGQSAYQTIVTQRTFGPAFDGAYQQFADVTAAVAAAGPGDYWGANVAAGFGPDRYAGWALVVVHRDPTAPLRNLTVFDGYSDVGVYSSETIPLTGFLTPLTGTVNTRLGIVAYDGDRGETGDQVFLNDTRLGSPQSGGSNFFNGTNDLDGRVVTQRTPTHANMLGFDIKQLGVPGAIPNGATSARIDMSTLWERYLVGLVTTSIDLYAPDLSASRKAATNLTGTDPAAVGDVIEYTLTYTNTGLDPAVDSVVTDPLPAGVTFVPGSIEVVSGPNAGPKTDVAGDDQAQYSATDRAVRVGVGAGASATTGGAIGPGESTVVRFRVVVGADAAGSTLVNRAQLDYVAATIGEPLRYVGNEATTIVEANADLSISKTTSPETAVAGADVTSTIVVTNDGPNPARTVTVTDTLDAGVTPVAAAPAGCTIAGQAVTCELPELTVGASATITVNGRVPPDATLTSSTNSASVTSSTTDPDLGDNTAVATMGVVRRADVTIAKRVAPSTVAPGGAVSFPITVTNRGPSTAVEVQIVDTLDPGIVDVTADPACAIQAGTVRCDVGTLLPNASVDLTIRGRLEPGLAVGSVVANTAGVSSTIPDPEASNDTSSVTVTAGPPAADLVVTKEVSPTVVVAGAGGASYTVVVGNDGPSDATGVTMTDIVPGGLAVTGVSSSRGMCVPGPTVTCTIDELPAGTRAVVTVDVDADAAVTSGVRSNSARVTGDQPDPIEVNNLATAPLEVTASADVVTIKQGSTELVPGGAGLYVIDVGNTGPSTARAVSMVDDLPDGITVDDVLPLTGTCEPYVGGAALTCQFGDIPPGGSAEVTVSYTVDADFTADELVNTAGASSPTPDPDTGNNGSTFTSRTTPQAELAIVKEPLLVPAIAGAPMSWRLGAINNGPSIAADVVLTDTLPAGVSDIVVPAGCTLTGLDVRCPVGAVAPGPSPSFTISATVPATAPSGTSLSNEATVTSATPDPSPASDTVTITVPVVARADVAVTKTADPPASPAGAGLPTFTITVTNDGPSVAAEVELADTLPFDAIIEEVTPAAACNVTGIDVECALGDLAPGASTEVQITYFTRTSVLPDTYINEATATSSTPDPDPSDNTGAGVVEVLAPSVDVTVDKTGPTEILAGGTFDYAVDVQNAGPSTAFDVVVTDVLPTGLTPESATTAFGSCDVSGQTVTCRLPFVYEPPFEEFNAPILISGAVSPDAAGTVLNTARAVTVEPDADETDNASSATSTVRRESSISVTKAAGADELVAGGVAPYTITVTNAGPSAAGDAVVTDVLPADVTFIPDGSDSRCARDVGGDVVCGLGTIEPFETVLVRVAGRVDPDAIGDSLTNTAFVTSTSTDPDRGDDRASTSTPLIRSADLATTKTAASDTVSAGTEAVFDVTVTNEGPSTASDVELLETIPPGTTLVSIDTTPAASCSGATCQLGDLLPGQSVSAIVTVAVPPSQPTGTITNVVDADSTTPDPNPGRRRASASSEVVPEADVAVVKTVATDPVVAGLPVAYDFVVTNNGPSDAVDTTLVDPLPPGTTFAGGTVPPGTVCDVSTTDAPVVSCILPLLPAGSSVRGQLVVATSADLTGTLVNGALVGSEAIDADDRANLSFAEALVVAADTAVDLAVTKQGPSELLAGGRFDYTIAVVNEGRSTSTAATVTDVLPSGLVPTSASIGSTPCQVVAQAVTCALDELVPGGAAAAITVTGDVATSITGATVTNRATAVAAGTETDPTDDTGASTATIVRPATPPATEPGVATVTTTAPPTRVSCADLTSAEAQRLLAAGAGYLDADDDGVACEAAPSPRSRGHGGLPATGVGVALVLVLAGAAVITGWWLRASAGPRARRSSQP